MTPSLPPNSCVSNAGPAGLFQTQVWLQDLHAGQSGAYNIPTALRLRGPLEIGALQNALDQVVARHESLRTWFVPDATGPQQVICPPRSVEIRSRILADLSPHARDAALRHELRAESRRPFDLTRDLLIRAALFRLAPNDHVLLVTMHHLASDGWTVKVFLRELKELYEAETQGRPPQLPELIIQYADYAAWQREEFYGGRYQAQSDYWRHELSGELPVLALPVDRPRTSERQFCGERERLDIPEAICSLVRKAAREFRVTEFTVYYSAFHVLLARYCDQEDILTGTVVSGRNRTELEPLIGFFVNLLAIRTPIDEATSTADLLPLLQRKMLQACANQDVPFDQVVAALDRLPGAPAPIQAVFALQGALLEDTAWGEMEVKWLDMNTGTAKFDLNLTIEQSGPTSAAVVEYRTELFDSGTIRRLLENYVRILEAMLTAPVTPIWQLPFLSSAERHLLTEVWSTATTDYPRESAIHELFEIQARLRPNATALVFGSSSLTYAALNERAEALAFDLSRLGAGSGQFVAICMERSFDFIVSVLAILKCAAAYLPLDPEYPPDRLAFMIRDSAVRLVLTHQKHSAAFRSSGTKLVLLDSPAFNRMAGPASSPESRLRPTFSPESPAYIMYTSGSTGLPKGVVVPHRGVVRLVKNTNYASLTENERILQFAPASFDASTFEIWAALLNGGTVCIAPPGKLSLDDLAQAIREQDVTTLWLTSALFNVMVEEQIDALKGLRQLLTGGDAASYSYFCKFQSEVPDCRLIHAYGPTENTTFTTALIVEPDHLRKGFVPIGKPIANTEVYILDRFLQPVPVGVVGELFTGGDGLALEYLKAPDLTAQKFIPHPFHPGRRLYRTGDRARFLPDGNIQFLGRIDNQLKIRGFRIEPGEIEHLLRMHPAVRDVIVFAIANPKDEKSLVCCWIPEEKDANANALRFFLKEKLPEYLVPSRFYPVERFPCTANGKVDRSALACLVQSKGEQEGSRPDEHATELEAHLLRIWRDVLHADAMGVHDDFFTVGGHSLLATQIISRVKQQLHLNLPLRFIFDHSTVAEFALAVRDLQPGESASRILKRDEKHSIEKPASMA